MDARTLELAGVILHAPVTMGTNLILAVTCGGCYARIKPSPNVRTTMWRRFFLTLAVATLLGVLKHGFALHTGSPWLRIVTLVSSVTGGLSTYYAQRATLESGLFTAEGRGGLLWLVRLQLFVFALQVFFKPAFFVVVVQSGFGLGGVLVAEFVARRRGLVGQWWTVGGILAALLTGVAYLLRWPSSLAFDHVDFAHVLMCASFVLLFRGAQIEARSRVIS